MKNCFPTLYLTKVGYKLEICYFKTKFMNPLYGNSLHQSCLKLTFPSTARTQHCLGDIDIISAFN